MMNKCLFCQLEEIRDDILLESENFFVKVGIGILAPGHVMLITKEHILCFAELPNNLIEEFTLIKNKIFEKLKSNFFEPIIYEHGVYEQSISHAHLHFLPKRNKHFPALSDFVLENVKENIFNGLSSTKVTNMFGIIDTYRNEGSYFYLEEGKDIFVFHTKNKPKGKFIFRKEFARLTGLKGIANWKTMTEEEKKRDKLWIEITKKAFGK